MEDDLCKQVSGEAPRILIVGCGDSGLNLARRLARAWEVTVVDLDLADARKALAVDDREAAVRFVEGDGTSRLVLESAGAERADAVVITVGPSDSALEVCRVMKREFPAPKVIALIRHAVPDTRYEDLGVEVVLDHEVIGAALASRASMGSRIAADVGLGQGELMETEVLPNSSVIGKKLSDLRPRRWRVAAIYREHRLVVPHGKTSLEGGDRVLLVGHPRTLPCIARYLRTGHSEFPLHYGAGLGLLASDAAKIHAPEVAYLIANSRARFVEVLGTGPRGASAGGLVQHLRSAGVEVRLHHHLENGTSGPATLFHDRDVGLVVLGPERSGMREKLGLKRSALMKKIIESPAPVLVSRGTVP